ncbi:MAG: hypothetical protein SX243_18090 [Acidobacteriota bacterium]|nr:hypothetical protein [Acidobacteriota bacterium]
MSTVPSQPSSSDLEPGALREAFLEWFSGMQEEASLRLASSLLQRLIHRQLEDSPPPDPESVVAQRVRAILADLFVLSGFLQKGVQQRAARPLSPNDRELVREAGRTGDRLLVWTEVLYPKSGLSPTDHPSTEDWERFFSLRETALWSISEAEAQALRDVTASLFSSVRRRRREAPVSSAPAIRDEIRAVLCDLRHLAAFTTETGELADEPLGQALTTLGQRLLAAVRRLDAVQSWPIPAPPSRDRSWQAAPQRPMGRQEVV